MPTEARTWLRLVATAHASRAEVSGEGAVVVRKQPGGANNALYRVTTGESEYAVKLYAPDERCRAPREFGTLCLLHEAGLDIAAEPLCLDESCTIVPFPACVYGWLSGSPLGPSLDDTRLAAIVRSFRLLHSLRADRVERALATAWFHWFDVRPYLQELDALLLEYGGWLAARGPVGLSLYHRLARLVSECAASLSAATVSLAREQLPLRLCHVDVNLDNALWCEDNRLRWVDWEYSGWGDPALELAELRWHVALEGLTEAQHRWLRRNYPRPAGDASFEERLALWDRLIATRWPFLVLRWLWSQDHGPDRVRLSHLDLDRDEMCARLVRLVERAEGMVRAAGSG